MHLLLSFCASAGQKNLPAGPDLPGLCLEGRLFLSLSYLCFREAANDSQQQNTLQMALKNPEVRPETLLSDTGMTTCARIHTSTQELDAVIHTCTLSARRAETDSSLLECWLSSLTNRGLMVSHISEGKWPCSKVLGLWMMAFNPSLASLQGPFLYQNEQQTSRPHMYCIHVLALGEDNVTTQERAEAGEQGLSMRTSDDSYFNGGA